MKAILDYLRQRLHDHDGEGPTDADLLASFLACREEAAFAALVDRHGPMVLSVAPRVLGHAQDAEDVFQATFLVLVRKARGIGNRDLLGNWLHGVAYRTALEARSIRARRRVRETTMDSMPEPPAPQDKTDAELAKVLDGEMRRLSEKNRAAIVLCDLEGRSRREAARQLRIPEGTLSSRLAAGRGQLARRLGRRGLTLSVAALTVALSQSASAMAPASLAAATVQSALCLANGSAAVAGASVTVLTLVDGVVKTMFLNKLKIGALLLVAIGLASLIGGSILRDAWRPNAGFAADPTEKVQKPLPQVPDGRAQLKDKPQVTDKKQVTDKQSVKPKAVLAEPHIQPGDRLRIHVLNTLPENPINGVFFVEASGKVALGPEYGRIDIGGLALEKAEHVVREHLKKMIRNPSVSITHQDPVTLPAIERDMARLLLRLGDLEKEVRELRTAVEKLGQKQRD